MWAGLADVLDQLAHDGQRGFDQRPYRRLRHGQREQLVGQDITRAVFGRGDEAFEFEHLEHAEQLAGGPAEALRDGRQVQRGLLGGQQFDDVETLFEGGRAVAAGARGVSVRRKTRGSGFGGHGFFGFSGNDRRGILPQNHLILNFH